MPMAKGVIPDSHPLRASTARSFVLKNSDVAVIIGARLNWMLHHGASPPWNKDCKIIHVDVSADTLKQSLVASDKSITSILGDARSFLNKLLSADFPASQPSPDWLAKIQSETVEKEAKLEKKLAADSSPLNYHTTYRVIRDGIKEFSKRHADHEPIYVSEGANTMDIGRIIVNHDVPRSRLDAGSWGTMGVGLGSAVAGAVVNEKQRLVVCLEGDSAFGFSGMECETICRYGLPVVIFVFNNGGIYGGDAAVKDYRVSPTQFVPQSKYELLMEAFGGKGWSVTNSSELEKAVSESLEIAFEQKIPGLVNIHIDPFCGQESGSMQSHN
jgi:2-hydroxyacyl-CoA lyase 1